MAKRSGQYASEGKVISMAKRSGWHGKEKPSWMIANVDVH